MQLWVQKSTVQQDSMVLRGEKDIPHTMFMGEISVEVVEGFIIASFLPHLPVNFHPSGKLEKFELLMVLA